eukprot:m.252775 g.252775  ORF g.252775 m.252775 type:complete len:196 (+) comp16157_c0_seq9:149-736(+)
MYGDDAIELLRELRRAAPHILPPFNEDRIRKVIVEIEGLFREVQNTLNEFKPEELRTPLVYGSMVTHHAAINRNKRCMLAYIMGRLERLKIIRWDVGAVLPDALKENLCSQERKFFTHYNRNLTNYMQAVGVDVSADLHPPKDLFIEVRCLEDVGEIMTENGAIMLEKDTQHFLRRSDIEPLIRQGILKHVPKNT